MRRHEWREKKEGRGTADREVNREEDGETEKKIMREEKTRYKANNH